MQRPAICNRVFAAAGFALLVNIFLFALLPIFVKSDFKKTILKSACL